MSQIWWRETIPDFIAVGSLRPRSRIHRTIALQALAVVYDTHVSELANIGNLLVLYITNSLDYVTNSIV